MSLLSGSSRLRLGHLSDFSIARSSALWRTPDQASAGPEASVRVFPDTDVADADPNPWSLTARQAAEERRGAMPRVHEQVRP